MITRSQAFSKVTTLIKNQNLVKHCLGVEAAMLGYATYFHISQEQQEMWAVAGLIHDADWEKFPDKHPKVVAQWVVDNGGGEDLVNAIEAHGFEFGIAPKTLMAKTLRAVDELTGLIVAVALVKDKQLKNVTIESIRKKWGTTGFAKGVKRTDIEKGAEEIGVPLEQHIEIVLSAMRAVAPSLGL